MIVNSFVQRRLMQLPNYGAVMVVRHPRGCAAVSLVQMAGEFYTRVADDHENPSRVEHYHGNLDSDYAACLFHDAPPASRGAAR